MFAGLIFDSGLAFLSFYEPTTHLDGSPEFLELQWKIKHMAAQVGLAVDQCCLLLDEVVQESDRP